MGLALGLSACAEQGRGRTAVLAFRSPDLQTWSRAEAPLTYGLESLGLDRRDDGQLWLSAVPRGRRAPFWERWTGPPVVGLIIGASGAEPAEWSPTHRRRAWIDPEWRGPDLWWVEVEGQGGDPARAPTEIWRQGEEQAQLVLRGQGLTDPAPLQLGGRALLFVTAQAEAIELYEEGRRIQRWPGLTTPFAAPVGQGWWLLATGAVEGRRLPLRATSADGQRWSSFSPVLPPRSARSCTSPVLGPDPAGGWLLLCVAEGGGRAAGNAADLEPGGPRGE